MNPGDVFEQHNPHALAQTIERMLEAARQGYWQTDAQTLNELKERWQDLAQRFEVRSENARFMAYVQNGTGTRPKAAPQVRQACRHPRWAPNLDTGTSETRNVSTPNSLFKT